MQSDRGFIKNIGDANEPRPDLGREPDPLRLSAGQGSRSPRERKIIETYIPQKFDTGNDLFQDLPADHALHFGNFKCPKKLQQLRDRQVRDSRDILIPYRDREGCALKPLSAAGTARCDLHELFVLCLGRFRESFAIAPLDIPDKAFKSDVIDALAPLPPVTDLHLMPVCSLDEYFPDLRRIFMEGRIEVELIFLSKRGKNLVRK